MERTHEPIVAIDGPADPACEPYRDRARLITLVAFGALRHAWANWAASDGSISIVARIEASFAGLAQLTGNAVPPDEAR